MTLAHARWWDRYVQPWIDRSEETRADKGWRWPRIFATTHLIGTAFRQGPVGLVAGAVQGDRFMPVAMAILVESYPHLPDATLRSVFLWYATRCPDNVIQIGLQAAPELIPKRLMEITVDLAVTHSFNKLTNGRVGLHAAAEGGEELCRKYDSFGMMRLPHDYPLPKGIRSRASGNDGRYFFHTEETGREASIRLDILR
jgi:hypothetical protein